MCGWLLCGMAWTSSAAAGSVQKESFGHALSGAASIITGPGQRLYFTSVCGCPGSNGDGGPISSIRKGGGDLTVYDETGDGGAFDLTTGPDGNIWFTQPFTNKVGRMTPSGDVTTFGGLSGAVPPFSSGESRPTEITTGADGTMWFVEAHGNRIGRVTTAGVVTEYPLDTGALPNAITAGPDGNVWFTRRDGVQRIAPDGTMTFFPGPTGHSIVSGPDGALWLTDGVKTYRITTYGVLTKVVGAGANSITSGPDGNLWLSGQWCCNDRAHEVLRIKPDGRVSRYNVGREHLSVAHLGANTITSGPDGRVWLTDPGGRIWRLTLP